MVHLEDNSMASVLPRSISINFRTSKQYGITIIVSDIKSFGQHCFTTIIVHSPCICYTRNCGVTHKDAVMGVKQGDLIEVKLGINTALLSEALLSKEITQTLMLEEWEVKFRSVASVGEDQLAVTLAGFCGKSPSLQNFKDQKRAKENESHVTTKQIVDFPYTFWMMGIPLDREAYMFGDDQTLITSRTIPHSSLNKHHNTLAYHHICEGIAAAELMWFFHINDA